MDRDDSFDREPSADELLLQRYIDDELRPTERRDFEQRLASEADLASRLREARELRGVFLHDRREVEELPPLGVGFAERAFAELRREEREVGSTANSAQETALQGVGAPTSVRGSAHVAQLVALKTWTLVAASIAILLLTLVMFWNPKQPTVMQAGRSLRDVDRRVELLESRERLRELEAKRREAERRKAERKGSGK